MILPIHPQPKPDELLSSWLVRLALKNGFRNHPFLTHVLGYKKPVWNRDIDKNPPTELIKSLSTATGLPLHTVSQLSLRSYTDELYTWDDNSGILPWILPLRIYHRTHLNSGLQICPTCLKEDVEPYYRKYWRLSLYTICPKHMCILTERCNFCGTPIQFHRLGIGSRTEYNPCYDLKQCYKCKENLSESSCTGIVKNQFTKSHISFITNYTSSNPGLTPLYTASYLSFFKGLRILLKAILRPYSNKLLEYYSKYHGSSDTFLLDKRRIVETYSVHSRYHMMSLLFWLIEQWPDNFHYAASHKLITRSSFSDDLVSSPYWLRKQIDIALPGRYNVPCKEELQNMLLYIQTNHGYLSIPIIKRDLQVSLDIANYYIKTLSKIYGIQIKVDEHHKYHLVTDLR